MSPLLSAAFALLAVMIYGVKYFVKKRNESKDLVSVIRRMHLSVLSFLISLVYHKPGLRHLTSPNRMDAPSSGAT
jgi:hypothetical protein